MLTCIVSKQQREVLHWDRNKKLLKKETKRAGGGRVLELPVPPRDQCLMLRKVLYPQLQATKGKREKGQQERTKVKGHRNGPSNDLFLVHLIISLSAPNESPSSLW